jgi:peptide/nickel transport system permease protein
MHNNPSILSPVLSTEECGVKKTSQFIETMRRLGRNKMAVAGMVIVIVYLLIAVFAPLIAPYDFAKMSFSQKNQFPSLQHLCGTDDYGRDIFSRLIYGTRYSLGLGFGAVMLGLVIGTILGCIAGFFGGWVEEIIMRLCDLMQAIPGILLAIIISAALGTGFGNTIIAIGVGRIAYNVRMVRAQFLSQRKLEYVEAAEATNCSKAKLMFVHILPNAFSPIIVGSTMGVGGMIMTAAGLSFINLGVQPPLPEWGAMMTAGRELMRDYPYQLLFPGIAMALLVLSLNLFGDALRDVLDPKLRD